MRLLLLSTACILIACTGSPDEGDAVAQAERALAEVEATASPTPAAEPVAMDGRVTLSVDRLIEEVDPNNCLVMMKVSNGTNDTVSAGLFAFQVEGAGESAGANMFPQEAEPGGTATAQIILPGRSCDVAETITGGQPACTVEGGESCVDALTFEDGEVDFAVQ